MSVIIYITQINPIFGNYKQNLQMISDAIQSAENNYADVVVFPKLALIDFPLEDLLFRPTFIRKVEESLQQIAKLSKNIMNIVGAPVYRDDELGNMVRVLRDGKHQDRRYPITSHYRWNLT